MLLLPALVASGIGTLRAIDAFVFLSADEYVELDARCLVGLVAVSSADIERAAAVDEERHAGDEIGLVGSEE